MDISSITAVIGSIKAATDIAKVIKTSDLSLEKAETKLKLAELVDALADAKMQMADVRQLVLDKDERIRELESLVSRKGNMVWEAPYYWQIDGDKKDGPFCQQCHDKDKEEIRLQTLGNGCWICKTCKSTYEDKSYAPPQLQRRTRDYI